jgi:hypothetical protein
MNSPAGKYCKKCSPGKGCLIFAKVNDRCKEYQCMYNQMNKCSENLRPDKCHVIFERLGNGIITGLIEKGCTMNDDVKNQIGSFIKEGFSVYMSSFGNPVPAIIPAKGIASSQVFIDVNNHLRKIT